MIEDQAEAREAMEDFDSAMVVMRTAKGSLIHINNSRRAVWLRPAGRGVRRQGDDRVGQSARHQSPEVDEGRDRSAAPSSISSSTAEDAYAGLTISSTRSNPVAIRRVGFEDGRRAQILAEVALESGTDGQGRQVDYRVI